MNGSIMLNPGFADYLRDSQRVSHAEFHCKAINFGVLCVHAVALVRDGAGVLLLGGHGAGKSLTGLAMAEHGWQVAAGDIAMVRVDSAQSAPALVNGTREFLVRPAAYGHWFPGRAAGPIRGAGSSRRMEVAATLTWAPIPTAGIPVRSAVEVAVDRVPTSPAQEDALDGRASAAVWYRASSRLLDRVLDNQDTVPLRCLEHEELAVKRLTLVRMAARALPVRWISGNPVAIAEAAEQPFPRFCHG